MVEGWRCQQLKSVMQASHVHFHVSGICHVARRCRGRRLSPGSLASHGRIITKDDTD